MSAIFSNEKYRCPRMNKKQMIYPPMLLFAQKHSFRSLFTKQKLNGLLYGQRSG
jgi:hypothetical protein